jgi:hypothetical protein
MSELIALYYGGIHVLAVTCPHEIGSCLEADFFSIGVFAKYRCFY